MNTQKVIYSIILFSLASILFSCGNPSSPSKAEDGGIDIGKIVISASVENPIPTAFMNTLAKFSGQTIEGPVNINITNSNSSEIQLTVSAVIEGYSNLAEQSIIIPGNGIRTIPLFPILTNDGLSRLTETKTANCSVKVTLMNGDTNQEIFAQSLTSQMLAKDVMIWQDGDENLSPLVALWVTPHAPKIKELIVKAANRHPNKALVGYQGSDANDGYAKRKYTSSSSTSVSAGGIYSLSMFNGRFIDTGYMSNIIISGTFSATGGSGNDIISKLKSGEDELLYNSGRVHQDSFSSNVYRSGYYFLYFDNSFSWLTDKSVTYSITCSYDEDVILPQVKAIYESLQKDYLIKYINSTISFPDQGKQTIRYPEESLTNGSANCIDGTVLFASALEYIGIEPYIMLIPGHAFVGWKRWTGSNKAEFLETTMISSNTFEEAYNRGNEEFNQNYGKERTAIFDVKQIQDLGLTPLAKPAYMSLMDK